MKRINWPSAIVTALVAYLTTFATFLLSFGNPVTRNILYTDSAGQSNKFLQVWHTLEPLPAVGPFWEDLLVFNGRKVAMLGLLFV